MLITRSLNFISYFIVALNALGYCCGTTLLTSVNVRKILLDFNSCKIRVETAISEVNILLVVVLCSVLSRLAKLINFMLCKPKIKEKISFKNLCMYE